MSSKDIPDKVTPYVSDALAFVKKTPLSEPSRIHASVLHAITNDTHVKNALVALPQKRTLSEMVTYGPTVRLLNSVSYGYCKYVIDAHQEQAIIFGSMANSPPPGIFLGLVLKPDFYAYLGTWTELHAIVSGDSEPREVPYSESILLSVHKPVLNGSPADGQLRSILAASERYRPDVPTVHSFIIEKGSMRLASLNACGTSMSSPVPWIELNSWVAHVVLLYETHIPRDDQCDMRKLRDKDITYCEFYRWDVQFEDGKKVAVTPFYVPHPLGRMTFACFDVLKVPEDRRPKGTPMFISVEVSKPRCLTYGSPRLSFLRDGLLAGQHDAALFKRAFPNGDGSFVTDFELVMKLEEKRGAEAEGTIRPPPARHDCRHDAESIYWIFLWAFARARPLKASPLEQDVDLFEKFCGDMFSHAIDGPVGEAGRATWIIGGDALDEIFHPLLWQFEILFRRMAKYLAIPWFLYCGEGNKGPQGQTIRSIMKPDHVHVAFHRLTLAFMRDPQNAEALSIALDTQAPRHTKYLESAIFRNPEVTTTNCGITGATGRAPYPATLHTLAGTQGSTSSQKRKMASTALPARKRKPSEWATMGDNLGSAEYDAHGDGVIANDHDNSPPDAGATAPLDGKTASPDGNSVADDVPTAYVPSQHQDAESAMVLHLMFWKDRTL